MNDLLRLQVYLARAGIASRRRAETYIQDGRVKVNGVLVTNLGSKVTMNDMVEFDNQQVFLETKKRYVLLNKPAGYVCSSSDEKNRPVASDLLKNTFQERLYNIGRLDMYSSGLLIFTNDGEYTQKLLHPSHSVEKEYRVQTSSPIPIELAQKFEKGVRIDTVFYKSRSCTCIDPYHAVIVLVEGKNREIRRVFDFFDVRIQSLERVRIGGLLLGDLQSGAFKEITSEEAHAVWL